MTRVVVPVRYPLSRRSKATLRAAVEVAEERDADLTVLHVDLYQEPGTVRRGDLKRAVEDAVGPIDCARYVVRPGFLVEQTILDEVAAEGADAVVVGHNQVGRLRRTLRKLLDEPDVEGFLTEHLDCEVVTVES